MLIYKFDCNKMRLNILIGGEAGQGPNLLANIIGNILVKKGFYVFNSRDYQSRVRKGHNFNILTISDESIQSNDFLLDILIALDKNTEEIHKKEVKKDGIILNGEHSNIYFSGRLIKLLGLDFKDLKKELEILGKKVKENLNEAQKGYNEEDKEYCKLRIIKKNLYLINGSQGIARGAVDAGLDLYYAYPMTPATPVLNELAQIQKEKNILTLELESEIAVINAGIGSSATGAKVMVGSSGGGFDLMTESLSLIGVAEIPLVIYLAQRQGPGTSSATYTAQADLQMALYSGHGEFERIVVAPGNPKEASELTSQAFYFSQKYKIPSIILSDKHLAESIYTLNEKPKITNSEKSINFRRYHDKEVDSENNPTENPDVTIKNVERRAKKFEEIKKELKNFNSYKSYRKKGSKNIVLGWGSTTGAILDAVKDLDCEFIQILYLKPFPNIKKELKGKNLILVENNSTGQLGNLITEKTGIFIENKILKYDGRPFFADELKKEIEKKLK